MGTADNKALIRRFYDEVWAKGNLDVADEVFVPDYVRHDFRSGDAKPGPEGQKDIARAFRGAFPDLRWDVQFVIAEDDYVAARWTATGTHAGPWAGIEATGRAIEFSGINVFRFDGAHVVELWNHRDDLGLLEQLGRPVFAGAPSGRA